MTGFATNWLRSTCFYKPSCQNRQLPLGQVGNVLERAWKLSPALAERVLLPAAVGGGRALRQARHYPTCSVGVPLITVDGRGQQYCS